MTPPPTAPGDRHLSYKICLLFTKCICYRKVYRHFLDGAIYFLVDFYGDCVLRGGKYLGSGGGLFKGNITQGEFLKKILSGYVPGNGPGKFFSVFGFPGKKLSRKGEFRGDGRNGFIFQIKLYQGEFSRLKSSARSFTEVGGGISSDDGTIWEAFNGGKVYFTWE